MCHFSQIPYFRSLLTIIAHVMQQIASDSTLSPTSDFDSEGYAADSIRLHTTAHC
jgi:hypothetical protein